MEIIFTYFLWAVDYYIVSIPFIYIFIVIAGKTYSGQIVAYERANKSFAYLFMISIIFILGITLGNTDIQNITLMNIQNNIRYIQFVPIIGLIRVFISVLKGDIKEIINFGGNILLFVPVGFFVSPYFIGHKHMRRNCILVCASISLAIELCQIFYLRACDINDFILNSLGGWLGIMLYHVLIVYDVTFIKNLNLDISDSGNKKIFKLTFVLCQTTMFIFTLYMLLLKTF